MEVNSRLPLILVILVGILFFTIGSMLLYNTYLLVKNGEKVIGKVIGFSEKNDNSKLKAYRKKIYAPIIEFQNADGEVKTFESSEFGKKGKYLLNQDITIITYDEYPFAKIDSFKSLWLNPIFVISFGLGLFVFGYNKLVQ